MNFFEGHGHTFAEAAHLSRVDSANLTPVKEHLVRELLAANRKAEEKAEAESHRGRVKLERLREDGLID
jgi:hypothetical protein